MSRTVETLAYGVVASILVFGSPALRAGYREPRGNWLRARQRDLQEQLWRLHCPRR